MAKKPTPTNPSTAPSGVTPPDLLGADIGGESPQKASPVPADAAVSFAFGEPQAAGGDTHQVAGGDVATLTSQQGIPVADDQNSLKQGARGPVLLEDFHYR